MGPFRAAWLAELLLVSWRVGTKSHRPPYPKELVATFVVFGGLGFVADAGPGAARVAGLFGWGLVLATFLNLFDPANPLAGANRSAVAAQGATLATSPAAATAVPPPPPAGGGGGTGGLRAR